MTDKLHKNTESCTGFRTLETDVEASNGSLCDQCVSADFARNLERERNILASGLRDVMNSSDSTSMYRIAKAALNKVTGQE
jgi:hypothetical protein